MTVYLAVGAGTLIETIGGCPIYEKDEKYYLAIEYIPGKVNQPAMENCLVFDSLKETRAGAKAMVESDHGLNL